MRISSSRLQDSRSATRTQLKETASKSTPNDTAPSDSVVFSSGSTSKLTTRRTLITAAVGAALGVAAGTGTGFLPGVVGGLTLAATGGTVLGLGTAIIAEQIDGSDASRTVGAGLIGGISGLVAGGIGGFLLGCNANGAIPGAILGVSGAAFGMYHGALNS